MMKWNTLKYLFKEGVAGLWKNRTMAIASAGTIVLCLLILGISYSVGSNVEYILEQFETKFGITSYIKDKTAQDRIDEIRLQIEEMDNVLEVNYISKEDALKNFSETNNDSGIFDSFKDDNPLPASFEIKTRNVEDQKKIVQQLEQIPELEETRYLQAETGMFIRINHAVDMICYSIIGCLIVVGMLLMSNTIKLTVYIRRKEINIMKYIGATDWFIRLPFLIEGILVGAIGALVATLAVSSIYDWVLSSFNGFGGTLRDISLMPTNEIMSALIPMYLSLGIGIGLVGSALSIHKHLKV